LRVGQRERIRNQVALSFYLLRTTANSIGCRLSGRLKVYQVGGKSCGCCYSWVASQTGNKYHLIGAGLGSVSRKQSHNCSTLDCQKGLWLIVGLQIDDVGLRPARDAVELSVNI
jgi:hypothetical protein